MLQAFTPVLNGLSQEVVLSKTTNEFKKQLDYLRTTMMLPIPSFKVSHPVIKNNVGTKQAMSNAANMLHLNKT